MGIGWYIRHVHMLDGFLFRLKDSSGNVSEEVVCSCLGVLQSYFQLGFHLNDVEYLDDKQS